MQQRKNDGFQNLWWIAMLRHRPMFRTAAGKILGSPLLHAQLSAREDIFAGVDRLFVAGKRTLLRAPTSGALDLDCFGDLKRMIDFDAKVSTVLSSFE